ncbi:hypothetical protein D3C87_1809300 [compost metagenome]
MPEQLRKLRKRRRRHIGVLMDQEKDRIDTVEKEMGIELVFQKIQFRFQLFFFQDLLPLLRLEPAFGQFDTHRKCRCGNSRR